MVKLNGKNKIICLALVLLIIAGVIVIAIKGFNVDLKYTEHEQIDIVIGKDFNLSDVKQITDEVFGNRKVLLRKIELFEDAVAIEVKYTTEDELSKLQSKFNEVYGLELNTLESKTISKVRIKDFMAPYILPIIITVAIVLVYVAVKYRKMSKKAIYQLPLKLLINEAIIEATLVSIIAVTRIPVNKLTMPILIIIGLVYSMIWLENKEKTVFAKEEKK